MPFIIAGAALLGTALTSQQQGQSSAAASRAQATQGQQAKSQQTQPFAPTAGASQQPITQAAPPEAMEMASGGRGASPMAQPPPAGASNTPGGSNTLGNINQAIQAGTTLQQVFQGQQAQGQNSRAQALAGRPQGGGTPFQPTAMSQMDPRLQQLLGR